MLTEVRKHFKLIFMCFKYNLIKSMDNKAAFIGQVFGMILNDAMMIVQWIILFSLRDNIGGYGFNDILMLWGLAAAIFGITHAFFNSSTKLSNLIMHGKLDAFLVQPKDTLIYASASDMSVSALGDILFGLLVLIFVKASIITSILFVFFAITGSMIYTSISIIYNSLSFFIGNAEDFAYSMESAQLSVSTYPDGIFSDKVRWIFMTIIPVAFSVYMPMKVLTEGNYILILIITAFAVSISIVAYIVFYKGLKKYNSGNLMVARI